LVRKKEGDLDQIMVSFFFTHFPENLNNTDLRKLFARFGNVVEVFVSKKRDRWGRRFGFMKYKVVANEEELGLRLEEVWWGDMKLKVNRTRFSREEKGKAVEVGDGEQAYHGGQEVGRSCGGRGQAKIRNDTSFARAVKGVGSMGENLQTKKHHLVINRSSDILENLKGSFVGFLKSPCTGEAL